MSSDAPLTFNRKFRSICSSSNELPLSSQICRNRSWNYRIQSVAQRLPTSLVPRFSLSTVNRLVEVAIHTILYVRQVYPAELFVRRKKYDTPVFQSRHPALNTYISGAIKAIGEELVLVCLQFGFSKLCLLHF